MPTRRPIDYRRSAYDSESHKLTGKQTSKVTGAYMNTAIVLFLPMFTYFAVVRW
jgi:hypothetical protein